MLRHLRADASRRRTLLVAVLIVAALAVGGLVAVLFLRGPVDEACGDKASTKVTVSGPQSSPYTGPRLTDLTRVDARTASWNRELAGDYPVIFKEKPNPAGSSLCFLGGTITSSAPASTPWETWHGTYGFYTDEGSTTIRGLILDNQGDGIGLKDETSSGARIQGVYATRIHDDVIENDWQGDVRVTDSLLEGYVVFAGRGYDDMGGGTPDGRDNEYVIEDTLAWLQPQPTVFKGAVPGTGPLFKRPDGSSEQGFEPNYTITNSIFRVDQEPNHGDLSIPPGDHSGNTIVWTGSGDYPGPVPDGFTLTTDRSVWDDAKAAWLAVPTSERTAPGEYRDPDAPPATSPAPPPPTPAVDKRVAAEADDAEELLSTGESVPTGSSDLEMTFDGTEGQAVGVRFTGLAIPAGAKITKASLGFTAAANSSDEVSLSVAGHDVDSAPTFTSATNDIANRPLTTARLLDWAPGPWKEGQRYSTPDLSAVVQELVDRPGWTSGNAMAFIVTGSSTSGTRTAEAYEGDEQAAATLHVEYTTG